jgi:putative glutamine amidotransferase
MKKIGICGYMIGSAFGVGVSYMRFIDSLDGEAIILSPTSEIKKDLDLLILPGGPDINPVRYGCVPDWNTSRQDPIREHFDEYHLPVYIKQRTSIFGICRGLQSLAVFYGATLLQDMYHDTNKDDYPEEAVHGIDVIGRSNLKIKVNSRHHQSVNPSELPECISILATCKDRKHHIEAIAIKDAPIRAIQWHPEDLNDWTGVKYAMDLVKEIMK